MSISSITTINEFSIVKNNLLAAYDKVLGSDLLPVGDLDEKKVKEKQGNLEDERFFLAVCGRIKSGKSMLLNALVFRSNVLPTDDTIMTAKNTKISYGKTPGLEVTFYNKKEWKDIIEEINKKKDKHEDFDKEIREAANKGVLKDECITDPCRVDIIEGLEKLVNYVTPTEKDGKFTPFVKQIILKYPHPWLEEVTVADTPGIDDPLVFRENITKKWIHEAGAVIYVTYAGQAMAKPDVDFMDEYLLHVTKDKQIIVVNKIDNQESIESVKTFISNLAKKGEYRIKSLFGDIESIVYVSALGGLIHRMEETGKPFDREMSEEREFMQDACWYKDGKKNGMDELQAKVEKRLISNKGQKLIEEHAYFLETVFEKKRRFISKLFESAKDHEKILLEDKEERKKKKKKIEQLVGKLSEQMEELEIKLNRELDKPKKKVDGAIKNAKTAAKEYMKQEFRKIGRVNLIGIRAQWILKDSLDNQKEYIFKSLKTIQEDVETVFKKNIQNLREDLDKDGQDADLNLAVYLDVPIYDTINKIRTEFLEKTSKGSFEDLISEATWFWQRWFDTEKGKEIAREKVFDKANTIFEEVFDRGLVEKITSKIRSTTKNARQKIQDEINGVLKKRKSEIEDIEQGNVERDMELKKVGKQIKGFREQKQALEKLMKEIEDIKTGNIK